MMDLQNLSEQQKMLITIVGIIVAGIVALVFIKIPKSKSSSLDEFTITSMDDKEVEVVAEQMDSFYVEISGNVKRPGIYELNEELMVLELIEVAGGVSENADIKHIHKEINLAEVVVPGQMIYIPAVMDNDSDTSTDGGLVSINTGSIDELMSLDGVGESTANKIVSARPYASLEDLMDVSGIGDATYNNIVSRISL